MARGESGRIVIEVDPDLKRQLYSALAIKSQSLKGWFIASAAAYLEKQDKASALKGKGVKPIAADKR